MINVDFSNSIIENPYALMMALNALEDPRKMHPKMTTITVVKIREFKGSPNEGWTLAKNLEAGRPPSLAKAHVIRLEVVMMDVVAKSRQTSGNMSKQTDPARELVAL